MFTCSFLINHEKKPLALVTAVDSEIKFPNERKMSAHAITGNCTWSLKLPFNLPYYF